MEDEEREDLLIRASSDNEEFTDNEDVFDSARGNIVQHENKTNTFYEKLQFVCIGLVLCVSSTALIILLPLYMEVVNVPGDAYTAILFTSFWTVVVLLVLSCVVGKFGSGVKAVLVPPFAFSTVLRTGLIYGISCFVVIYSLERKKVICHLQDPIKGIVLVFSLVYYFFFCRKMMGLQKMFCSTTIIVGLFISVDYGLCDEFRCRGYERQRRSEDAGDWSWQSHSVWTLAYIVALALWSLSFTLLEGQLVTSAGFTYIGMGGSRLATVSRLVSTRDSHSHSSVRHSRPLLQITEDSQDLPSHQEPSNGIPSEHRRHITYMKHQYCDPSNRPRTLSVALWLHLWTFVLVVALCWTDMTSVLGKGSSAAEFFNLTRNGLYCHFGGHNKQAHNLSDDVTLVRNHEYCYQVTLYAWPFLTAYILFVLSSVQFLIISESAVFTVAMSTTALPLAGIWWSLFRMVGATAASSSGLLQWCPVVTGELICSLLGLPIVLIGVILLFKAHFKERSYGKVAIACLRQQQHQQAADSLG
ncbi:uncharacterized protein [Periplaneta americana]|uniref:uncharacterized protein n=1 Tax=Periplaneta americana TaxID=6978 RepID=UPI0037E7058E